MAMYVYSSGLVLQGAGVEVTGRRAATLGPGQEQSLFLQLAVWCSLLMA